MLNRDRPYVGWEASSNAENSILKDMQSRLGLSEGEVHVLARRGSIPVAGDLEGPTEGSLILDVEVLADINKDQLLNNLEVLRSEARKNQLTLGDLVVLSLSHPAPPPPRF